MGKVDPNEAQEGTKAVIGGECKFCVFRNIARFDECNARNCTPSSRDDGCDVHFEPISVSASASFPYDDMGTYVEVTK